MISTTALIAKFKLALSEKWGYIWGGDGDLWTAEKQKKATREMTVKYGSKWIGRRVADCSGLFSWAFNELDGYMYHGSNTMWNKYCVAQGDITPGIQLKPGTAVFLKDVIDGKVNRHHVGLYIGNDTVIEAKGTAYGVVTSKLAHWDEWGELKGVDYSGIPGEVVVADPSDLKRGSTGAEVKKMQELLIALGFDCGPDGADGKFGKNTEAAVIQFQKVRNLVVDGMCGDRTWSALKMASNTNDEQDETGVNIEVPLPKIMTVTAPKASLNVRTGPGTEYPSIATLTKGTRVKVYKVEGRWASIEWNDGMAWVSANYLV